jgi:hypothetical protein
MSDIKIPVPGLEFQSELSTTQVPVASGAGSIAAANNIVTVTTAGAHGLTLTPAAGTLANYFVTFTGVTAQTGVGTLNGPIFRILAIPSTTTIQIYSTVTGGTFTAGTIVPVFIVPFIGQLVSGFVNGPTMTGVGVAPALVASGIVNALLGPNCVIQYNPDNTSVIQDPTVPTTLAVAPVYRTLVSASTNAQQWLMEAAIALFASGTAGTSRVSVIA